MPGEYVLTLGAVSALDNRVLRTAVARGSDQGALLADTERKAVSLREADGPAPVSASGSGSAHTAR